MDASPLAAPSEALPAPAASLPTTSEGAAAAVDPQGEAMDVDVGGANVAEPAAEEEAKVGVADLILDHGKISFDSETSRFELHLSLKGNLTHLANLESQGERGRPRSFLDDPGPAIRPKARLSPPNPNHAHNTHR